MNDERFLLRTEGGPDPGTRVIDGRVAGWTWPLPDVLHIAGGQYVKTSESQLPPQPRDGHVLRGATYTWRPDQQPEDTA